VTTLREACELPLDEVLGRLDDPVLQRRTKHIVTEIGRVEQVVALLEAGRIGDLGPVFDESHVSMRDDFEISSPELDLAVATAQASGALGARMTGGGFGGSAIALVPVEALDTVA
jgi:galactokinase